LELIYDSADRDTQHLIILVGDPSTQALASVASNVRVLKFADLEREGFKVEKILSPLPSLYSFSRN
jgi:long-chain acyl-CoA synthetase